MTSVYSDIAQKNSVIKPQKDEMLCGLADNLICGHEVKRWSLEWRHPSTEPPYAAFDGTIIATAQNQQPYISE